MRNNVRRPGRRLSAVTDRLRDHPFIFWFGLLASLASIAGFVGWFYDRPSAIKPSGSAGKPNRSAQTLALEQVEISTRGAIWDNDAFTQDEIVFHVRGGNANVDCGKCLNVSLVAFWRLANAYETNWHVSRRRVGSSYRVASIAGSAIAQGTWEGLFGGVECKKDYAGDIGLVVILLPDDTIQRATSQWLDDGNGWGFEQLPGDAVIAESAMKVVSTRPVR